MVVKATIAKALIARLYYEYSQYTIFRSSYYD